jgi:hypothetical protein
VELNAWTMSQFVHGEQGALLATAQLVETMKELDSKLFGATQIVDEARHVEVMNRYVQDKIGHLYAVDPSLKKLLDLMLTDSRWDFKFLGMQILVEGMALAVLATLRDSASNALLRGIAGYVMGDEARHMAYGIVSLRDYYTEQSEGFRREREDYLYEGACLLRDRIRYQGVWEALDLPVKECVDTALRAPSAVMYRQRLFSKIVPTVKKLGLLSPRQRKRFSELGILAFEDAVEPY